MKDIVNVIDEGEYHIHPPVYYRRTGMKATLTRLVKKYGIALAIIVFFTLYTSLVKWVTETTTENRVRGECRVEYTQMLEDYKEWERIQRETAYEMSEEARKEAAINADVEAVAGVIARLSTDQQKLTEAACMLARVMNPLYPNSFKEVVDQPQQWMFYDGTDKTFSMHDRELAEQVIRPYLESGIIPNGLSPNMIYGSWSTNDFVLRDSFESNGVMNTWRYQG